MQSLECHGPERGGRTLPGEVTDNIIDHLYGDTKTLLATALVCRSWLPASQSNLFYITTCQPPAKGLMEFVAWSSLAQYALAQITILIIESNFREYISGDTQLPAICVQDVEIAIERLPSLGALILRGVTLTSRIPAGGLYQPSPRRTLEFLKFWMVATADSTFYPILRFLSLFSQVDILDIDNLECTWNPDSAPISSLCLASPNPHALAVNELVLASACLDGRRNGYDGIVHLFHHTQPKWQLKKLMLACNGMQIEEVLGEFLPDCQESLTWLGISTPLCLSPNDTPADSQGMSMPTQSTSSIH